jgi:hypothetical protein
LHGTYVRCRLATSRRIRLDGVSDAPWFRAKAAGLSDSCTCHSGWRVSGVAASNRAE